MYSDITIQQEKLERLFEQSDVLKGTHEELHAHFVRYLCIRTSGYIEEAVRTVFSEYVKVQTPSAPHVAHFAQKKLERFPNPRISQIFGLAGEFSAEWKQHIIDKTQGKLSASVESIVNNRNTIAHGSDVPSLTIDALITIGASTQSA